MVTLNTKKKQEREKKLAGYGRLFFIGGDVKKPVRLGDIARHLGVDLKEVAAICIDSDERVERLMNRVGRFKIAEEARLFKRLKVREVRRAMDEELRQAKKEARRRSVGEFGQWEYGEYECRVHSQRGGPPRRGQ